MSSTVEPQSASKYVDYDEFVDYQLKKTRSEIKWTEILTTLVGIFTLTLCYLFVFTILDHWVIEGGFSRGMRLICLLSLAAVSATWVVWKILLPMWKEVHGLYAARMIEEHVPSLKSNLLNLIDLQRSGREPNPSIRSALEKRSAVELSHVDMDHVIDRRQLLRISYILLAVVVLCSLYALMSPKPISLLRPLTVANIPVATRTRIVEVKPGDVTVLARRPVDIQVTVSDKKPDRVLFHFTTKDQSFVDEQLELTPSPDREGEYQLLFAGENGDGIGQEIQYFITAGDARSETYTISVQTAPIAEIDSIELTYPDYMQLDPRTQFIGAIDAWEGTEVALHARIGNKVPVQSALLQFVDREQTNGGYEEIPLTVLDNNRLTGRWKLKFREDGTYAREYRIVCTSKEGLKDPSPPTYPITIHPDVAPEVALLDPSGDIEKPANAVIPLLFKARDPDFMLRYISLRVKKGEQELQSYLIFDGEQKAVADRYRWDLKPLGLQPGEEVSFYLEARDNKEPFGNRRTTQRLNLTIVAPADQQQVDEQLQREEQEQEPQLQEEQRQADQENGEEGGASESQKQGDQENDDSTQEQQGNKPEGSEGEQEQPSDKNESTDNGNAENEGNKGESGTSNTSEKDTQSSDEGEQKSDIPTEGGEEGAGKPQESMKNDGTDDAEVLDKILKDQQQNPEPGSNPPPPEQRTENQNSQTNDQSGTGNQNNKPEAGTGAGQEQANDDQKDQSPAQPGKGNGSEAKEQPENNSPTTSEGNEPGDGKRENTTEEGSAEKRPGNADTQGEGTPDKNTDPKNATRASDPNNIQRKEGTEPSTVPSSDPKSQDNLPKENTAQKPKQPPKGGTGSGKTPDPTAPNQPEGANEPNPAENDPNQRSKQPQGGEEGSSQQASDGTEGDTGVGDSKSSGKPGSTEQNPSGKEGGEPGQESGAGKESGEGESQGGGNKPSEDSGGGAAEQSQQAEGNASKSHGSGSSTSPGGSSSDGQSGPRQGGNRPGDNNAGTGPAGRTKDTREKENLENAKQAADLVLKRLEQQLERGEVNEELLKELGWTEEEMKAFAERMRRQLETDSSRLTAEDQARQRQFEEMLKNTNFDPQQDSVTRKHATSNRPTRSISGGQRTLPLEFRDAYEEWTRKINRQK